MSDLDRTRYEGGGYKGGQQQQEGPSASKIIAVITLLPVGGGLLALSGVTLVGTLIGLAVATPLFLLLSPVLVPAALVIGLAVMAFLASGTFGATGLTSLTWVVNYLKKTAPAQLEQAKEQLEQQLEQAKKRMQDMQKTKEMGQETEKKGGNN